MLLIPTTEFLSRIEAQGIGFDPRYPRSASLTFVAAPGNWRTSELPPAGELAWFLDLLLREAAGDDGAVYVYPRHSGHWYMGGDGAPWVNDAQDVVVRGAGIPVGFEGAAEFPAGERAAAAALALGSLVFGWGTGEDLYIVPADARCILLTSHHRVVEGHFRSLAERDAVAARIRAAGYQDPEDTPESASPEIAG